MIITKEIVLIIKIAIAINEDAINLWKSTEFGTGKTS
jgi:hypothetical protein